MSPARSPPTIMEASKSVREGPTAPRVRRRRILNETPAPPASGGDAREARPARAEPRPERSDAKLAAG